MQNHHDRFTIPLPNREMVEADASHGTITGWIELKM